MHLIEEGKLVRLRNSGARRVIVEVHFRRDDVALHGVHLIGSMVHILLEVIAILIDACLIPYDKAINYFKCHIYLLS